MGGNMMGGQRSGTSRHIQDGTTLSRLRKHYRGSTALSNRALFWGAPLVGAALLSAIPAAGNPTGGSTVGGAATIAGEGTGSVTVNQTTDRAILHWDDFSIGAGETTQFVQPGSGSIALNRVTGTAESILLGTLTANGNVWLINPNGVMAGAGSTIDVNGFLATTANILDDANFLSGGTTHVFGTPGMAGATVINDGSIVVGTGAGTVRDHGLAMLVAPGVENSGTIVANLGRVVLGGTETFTLDLTGDNLTLFQVTPTGSVSGATSPLVTNSSNIFADGGLVLISANAASNIVGNAINLTGVIQADTITKAGGTIILSGGSTGSVATTGSLLARGADAGESGGSISISGSAADIGSGAIVDASGDAAGGQIAVDVTTATIDADLNAGTGTLSGTASTVHVTSAAASIQDAIDIAGVGAVLNIGTGTYDEQLTINTALRLTGASDPSAGAAPDATADTIVQSSATPAPGIADVAVNASNVTLENIVFDFNGAADDRGGLGIFVSDLNGPAVTGVTIQNNQILTGDGGGLGGTGIQTGQNANVTDLLVTSNYFFGDATGFGEGVFINEGPGTNIQITDNTMRGLLFSGVSIESGNVTVSGNDIQSDVGQGVTGVRFIDLVGGQAYSNVTIGGATLADGNTIDNFATGVAVGNTSAAASTLTATIQNNSFSNNPTQVDLRPGADVDLAATFGANTFDLSAFAGAGTGIFSSIQTAINEAATDDTVTVGTGIYVEDLSITTAGLDLAGNDADQTATTIQGVATNNQDTVGTDQGFPEALPNIDIQADGVSVHGFTIASPDVGPVGGVDQYASGIVLSGTDIEIFNNTFEIRQTTPDTTINADGNTSVAIQTWSGGNIAGNSIDGLYIHDNTFDGAQAEGYYGVYINPQGAAAGIDPGDEVRIADNVFTGTIWRGISTQRSNVDITGNTITTDTDPTVFTSNSGVMVTNFGGLAVDDVTISGNSIGGAAAGQGFADGLRLGFPGTTDTLTNLQVASNTFADNDAHIALYTDIRVDATTNTFDGVLAGDGLTDTQGFAIEDKIDHGLDDPAGTFDGFVVTRDNEVYVTQDSASVQRGVDAAEAGDTVNVAGGTYADDVVVGQELNLDLSGTVIVSSLTATARIGLEGILATEGGNLIFDAVTLTDTTLLDTDQTEDGVDAGAVTIASVDSTSGQTVSLSIDTTGADDGDSGTGPADASGAVGLGPAGQAEALASLDVDGGTLTLGGDIFVDGGGAVDLTDVSNVLLAIDVTIDSDTADAGTTAAGGILLDTTPVNGDGAGPWALALDATATDTGGAANTAGAVTLDAVGATTPLASLAATGRSVTLNGAISTDGGDVALTATDSQLVVAQSINTGTGVGAIDLTGAGVSFDLVTVDADDGTVTVDAGADNIATASGTLILTSGTVEFIADTMDIADGSQIGGTGDGTGTAATVILRPTTAGTTIGVATNAFGDLQLDTAALSAVRATDVRIGSPGVVATAGDPGENTAGAIQVGDAGTASWAPAATFAPGTLTLASAAGITQESTINLSASGGGLILRAGSDVGLGDTDNMLNGIAAELGTGGHLTIASASPLTVANLTDDLGTVEGITAPGGLTLRTDTLDIDFKVNTSGIAAIEALTGNRPVSLGAESGTALSLIDAELDLISADTLRIGSDTGTISFAGAVSLDAGKVDTLSLATGGSVTQSAAFTVANLAIDAGSTISLTQANDVLAFAAKQIAGSLSFTDGDGFTVTSVDGVNGISTPGSVQLTAPDADSTVTVAAGASIQAGSLVQVDADNIDLNGPVSTTSSFGSVRLRPVTDGRTIAVGGAGSAGEMVFDTNTIGNVATGILYIGGDSNIGFGLGTSGQITVGAIGASETEDIDSLLLLGGGDLTFAGPVEGSFNLYAFVDVQRQNAVGGDILVEEDIRLVRGAPNTGNFIWFNAENVQILESVVADRIIVDVGGAFANVDLLPADPAQFAGLDINLLSISRASSIEAFGAIRDINTKAAALDLSNFSGSIEGITDDAGNAGESNNFRFNTCVIGTADCINLPALLPVGALDLSLDDQRLLREFAPSDEEEFNDLLSNSGNEELW